MSPGRQYTSVVVQMCPGPHRAICVQLMMTAAEFTCTCSLACQGTAQDAWQTGQVLPSVPVSHVSPPPLVTRN